MSDFFTSWFAVIIFLTLGVYLVRSILREGIDFSSGSVKDLIGGIGALIYSITLAVAKLIGKV
jgi:hypothetical protein